MVCHDPHLPEPLIYNNSLHFIQCKVFGLIHQLLKPCLDTPPHDPRALAHSQLHPESLHPTFPYLNHLWPDLLSKIQRLCLHSPFLVNARIPKPSSTHVSSTSTVTHPNSAQNKTRSLGSCHTCKPDQLMPGVSTSWPKSLKRHYGTTQRTNSCKNSNDALEIWTNEQGT